MTTREDERDPEFHKGHEHEFFNPVADDDDYVACYGCDVEWTRKPLNCDYEANGHECVHGVHP
jgi:hypothetical protein